MVNYEYNVELEQFKRVDNRGPSLPFNIVEARRIESMMNLGMKAPTIFKKIDFVNEVSMTNLRTFMNNLKDGNIIGLDNDYPAPQVQFESMDLGIKVDELEKRLKNVEDIVDKNKTMEKGIIDRIRTWI